jgi:putative ABC transport system permease protein
MDALLSDIRYGFRTFVREPAVALTAILALALGIGANTAVFSVVYAVLLKPLPYPQPEQLIYAHDTYPAVTFASVGFLKLQALQQRNRTLVSLAGSTPVGLTFTGSGDAEQVNATRVSTKYFAVFGVSPLHGRWFSDDENEPGRDGVVMLSYGLWLRRFAGDAAIVGQVVTVDGVPRIVVGVMPQGFQSATAAWVPLGLNAANAPPSNFMRLSGRMRPGVTVDQVQQDLGRVSAEFNTETNQQRDVKVWTLHEIGVTNNRRMLLVLQGTVVFVLLVACANVANLLLARSVTRQKELAIRAAVGAGRGRLVRQLLTESVLLSVVGGASGVLLAGWLLRVFVAIAPAGFPRVQSIAIDTQVLTFTVVVATLTGLLFGLAPARQGFRTNPNDSLRDAGARGASAGGTRGASRVLVIAEVALALVLVVGAGLLVKSLLHLQNTDPGFEAGGLLTFEMNLPRARYPDNTPAEFYRRFLDEVRSVPGVQSAAAINWAPLVNFGFNGPFSIVGQPPFDPARAPVTEYRVVAPGYFATMNIPVKRGAEFTDRHTPSTPPVVLINETMANRYFDGKDPVGARMQLDVVREVIGVVGDVRSWDVSRPPVPEVFTPHAQTPSAGMSIVARLGDMQPETVLPSVRDRLGRMDSGIAIVRPRLMQAVIDSSNGGTRTNSILTSVFALLAALLASVGVYSLIAYSVVQRTRELGIRIALGAGRPSVIRLIVGEGLMLGGAGIVLGLIGSFGLTRTLGTMLYEVSPTDPAVLALTCAVVLVVAVLASLIPALRAVHVDPMVALRAE